MKKNLMIMMVLAAMLALALCACGQQGGSDASSSGASEGATGAYATMADAFAVESGDTQWSYNEKRFAYAFGGDGSYTRVVAELEDGMYDDLNAADFDQSKVEDIVGPLAVAQEDVFTAIAQDELDAYAGKTGADITAAGFEISPGAVAVNGKETDCSAIKDGFSYLITFDGAIADENTDDPAGAVAELTVKSVAVQSLAYTALDAE